jgi:hypothetical protein
MFLFMLGQGKRQCGYGLGLTMWCEGAVGVQLQALGPKLTAYMDETLSFLARRIGECAQEWTTAWVGYCEQVSLFPLSVSPSSPCRDEGLIAPVGRHKGALDRTIVYVKEERDARDGRLVDKRGQPLPRELRPGAESNMRPDAASLRYSPRQTPEDTQEETRAHTCMWLCIGARGVPDRALRCARYTGRRGSRRSLSICVVRWRPTRWPCTTACLRHAPTSSKRLSATHARTPPPPPPPPPSSSFPTTRRRMGSQA